MNQEAEECSGAQCEIGPKMTDEGVTEEYENASLAVLLAMVPLLVFTLFGQMSLF
ncbi:MAG: hypothetical protein IPN70_02145 [Candidatus Moraniibacteriota bacterium]|nr:MAG: hypothetical protein IPN70_02145 [Candidatus Moranbacteria bacterium]